MRMVRFSGVVAISAALLQAALAQPAAGPSDEQIVSAAVALFDDLCITRARQEVAFYEAMKKTAKRTLAADEYARFLPSKGQKEDYFEVPILDGKAVLIVGRVAYPENARNCIVVMKSGQEIADRQWHELYRRKYSRNNPLGEDHGTPYYFVRPGRNDRVLVQIANPGDGFMSYYSFFK